MRPNSRLEHDRKRFIEKCLRERAQAYVRLKFMETQRRYDADPSLSDDIEAHRTFIGAIDVALRTAGYVLH